MEICVLLTGAESVKLIVTFCSPVQAKWMQEKKLASFPNWPPDGQIGFSLMLHENGIVINTELQVINIWSEEYQSLERLFSKRKNANVMTQGRFERWAALNGSKNEAGKFFSHISDSNK